MDYKSMFSDAYKKKDEKPSEELVRPQARRVVEPIKEEVSTPKEATPTLTEEEIDRLINERVNQRLKEIEESERSKKDHPARRIMRDDVSSSVYAMKALRSSYSIYNKEVDEHWSRFSKENRANGGVPIMKTQIIEILLDVAYYDMGIEPDGFESAADLRAYIQSKIK